jgi:formate dehydrogenase maturation protein FdhE
VSPAGYDEILKALEEAERKDGGLPPPLAFFRELTLAQAGTDTTGVASAAALSKDRAGALLEAGKPLLAFKDFRVDWNQARSLYKQVAGLLVKYADIFETAPPRSTAAPSLVQLHEAARAWFEGVTPDVDSDISPVVVGAALRPFLTAARAAVSALVGQEAWKRGFCPVCGGSADFGYLESEHGSRWLVCSRCDMEWEFKRLECPCCGNLDEKALSYFTDDAGRYRLYVCDSCRHYLKAIDLRKVASEPLYPVERILTVNADVQARESGYAPPTEYRRDIESALQKVEADGKKGI